MSAPTCIDVDERIDTLCERISIAHASFKCCTRPQERTEWQHRLRVYAQALSQLLEPRTP